MLDSAIAAHETVFAVPETTAMVERVVVAPCPGRFAPMSPEEFSTDGEWVEPGQVLGEIVTAGKREPVCSPFRGWVMGMLALPGQPVHQGEALFWVSGR